MVLTWIVDIADPTALEHTGRLESSRKKCNESSHNEQERSECQLERTDDPCRLALGHVESNDQPRNSGEQC